MHTLSSILFALQVLGFCVVAVLLIRAIVILKNKLIFQSQTPLGVSEPKTPIPNSTKNKNKQARIGRLKLTSTHRNRQIHLPDYPRYRISRSKGAKRRLKPCFKRMTLHMYLTNRRQRQISRFNRISTQNLI